MTTQAAVACPALADSILDEAEAALRFAREKGARHVLTASARDLQERCECYLRGEGGNSDAAVNRALVLHGTSGSGACLHLQL